MQLLIFADSLCDARSGAKELVHCDTPHHCIKHCSAALDGVHDASSSMFVKLAPNSDRLRMIMQKCSKDRYNCVCNSGPTVGTLVSIIEASNHDSS